MPSEIDGNSFDELREIVEENLSNMTSGEFEIEANNPYILISIENRFMDSESGTITKLTRGATVDETTFTGSFTDMDKGDNGWFEYTLLLKEERQPTF